MKGEYVGDKAEQDRAIALAELREMVRAATAGGYSYKRGNPRPFEVLPDGRLAIDYFVIRDIVAAFDAAS